MKNDFLFRSRKRRGILKIIFSLIFIVTGVASRSQSKESSGSIFKGGSYDETFSTDRIGLAQSVMTVPKGEYHLVIIHRFGEISTGIDQFFGLDGAVPRIGFEYGITNWLSAGVSRSQVEKIYDLGLKASILKQNENSYPVSLSYFVAALSNTTKNYFPAGHDSFGSTLSIVNQVFVARNQGIFSLQVSPLWFHSVYEVRTGGKIDILAIDLAGRIKLTEKLGLIGEYIHVISTPDLHSINPLTFGLDINTGGHQFQVMIGNSQGLNEKGYLTDSFGSWTKGHLFLGFNLTRVFNRQVY
jgi:hypothetical protein